MTNPTIDLLELIGADTTLKKTANVNGRGPEYHGACPFCGGKDRLAVQPQMGQWWCRQCSPNEHWQSAADYVMRRDNVDFKAAMKTLGLAPPEPETWDYHDEHGTVIYQVVRYIKNGEKSYYQRTPDGRGDWRKGLNGVQPTIYHLPEVLRAAKAGKTIYVCEGEKCADALRRLGLVATTNSGGAGKWRGPFSAYLEGAGDVVIFADNDDKGRAHAIDVLKATRMIVPSVRIVEFADLPTAGDVADWLALGHTKEQLLERCKIVAVIQASDAPPAKPVNNIEYKLDLRQYGISAADLQALEFPPLKWIVDGVLPEGGTLLAGKPKSKKSWLALAVAAAVAMGGHVLGHYDVLPGDVLYLDLESNQRRMKSRLGALLGAVKWPKGLHIFTKWERGELGITMLDAWMTEHPNTKLVVIDILQNFRPPRDPKGNPYDQDYEAVKMINEFAERHRIAVIIIHHTRKAKADDVFDEISGTTGLSGGVASMWVLGRPPDNSGESILAIRGRDISDDDPMALKWDHYTCQFVRVASGVEISSSGERRAILDAMALDLEYQLKDIAATVGKSVSATSNHMRRLMDDNLVQRVGNGRYAKIPQRTPYLDESRESRESREDDVSSESVEDETFTTFTHFHMDDVKVDSALERGKTTQNGDFHDFHVDLGCEFSIDCAIIDGREVWRLWDDITNTVLSEHATEVDAQNEARRRRGSAP